MLIASQTKSEFNASSNVLPDKTSAAIAAECVIPEQPNVSTRASSIIPFFTLSVSLQAPCCGASVLILIVGGIITGFFVYFMSQVIYAFGLNGYLPEMMEVWTPIIITACLSVTILLQQEEG